jgi:predicted nucleotidyltransferase
MTITDTLLKGVVMTKDSHDDIRHLAVKTTGHTATCTCRDCQKYRFLMDVTGRSTKDTEPTISQALAESFKAVVTRHDEGAAKPVSGVIVADEDGRGGRRKRKKASEQLLGSLGAVLRR